MISVPIPRSPGGEDRQPRHRARLHPPARAAGAGQVLRPREEPRGRRLPAEVRRGHLRHRRRRCHVQGTDRQEPPPRRAGHDSSSDREHCAPAAALGGQARHPDLTVHGWPRPASAFRSSPSFVDDGRIRRRHRYSEPSSGHFTDEAHSSATGSDLHRLSVQPRHRERASGRYAQVRARRRRRLQGRRPQGCRGRFGRPRAGRVQPGVDSGDRRDRGVVGPSQEGRIAAPRAPATRASSSASRAPPRRCSPRRRARSSSLRWSRRGEAPS